MEIKIIEHELKQIKIVYGYNNNAWTDEDEILAEALEMIYDDELQLNKESEMLMTDYYAANRDIESNREKLGELAIALSALRIQADDMRKYFGLPVSQPFVELSREAEEVSNRVEAFRVLFMSHEERMSKLCARLNDELQEPDNLILWDQYSEIKCRHYNNSESNSIDIVHYDSVDNEMKNMHAYYADLRRGCNERCREIHDENRCFALESGLQFSLWDEFVKRLLVLGYIFGQKERLPGTWNN